MTTPYQDAINLIERLHRQFLDVLKLELERAGVLDINNVQALILYNIGDSELTVGELTERGYYLGSNVSYNVKKMVENGYLQQERSIHDKRSVRVKLSEKGRTLHRAIANLYKSHETALASTELNDKNLGALNESLRQVEQFWSSQASGGNLILEQE